MKRPIDTLRKAEPMCAVIHKDYVNDPDRSQYVETVSLERGRELTSNGHYVYAIQYTIFGTLRNGRDAPMMVDVQCDPADLIARYRDKYPEVVLLTIHIALPDRQYLAGKS